MAGVAGAFFFTEAGLGLGVGSTAGLFAGGGAGLGCAITCAGFGAGVLGLAAAGGGVEEVDGAGLGVALLPCSFARRLRRI